jgi:hypothetical protein
MSSQSPSRAARIGYGLVTFVLVITVAFTALQVVSIGVGVARDGRSLLWGSTLQVPATINPESIRLPAGVRPNSWPKVSLQVKHPTTKQMLLRSLIDLSQALLFVPGAWLMWGLASSVRRGDPFGPENVRRLRGLGWILVVGAPLVELLNTSLRESLYNALPPNRFGDIGVAGFTPPGNAMLAGLAAFILAEVFAHGVRLREDVEATI